MATTKQATITVAVLALIGTLGAALINNWPWRSDEGKEPQPNPVRLLVVVRDAADQSPVRGAVVEIAAGASVARDSTGTDGRASFTLSRHLINEMADVSASAPGYSQVSEKYLIADQAPRHTLVLTKKPPAQPPPTEEDRLTAERPTERERIEVAACSNLEVTAEWQGVNPSTKFEGCRYSPPAGWRLIRHRVEVHSENNGSYEIEYGQNSMEVRVKATAHGSPIDRKRGWINITVYALVEEVE